MPEYPYFSIIIPVKNEAFQIRACLESIRKLDYPQDKIEVILADGLSRDDTAKIGESLGAKVVSNLIQTVGPGRNAGFAVSGGEYIVFSDADCVFPPDYLRNSLKYFKTPRLGGIGGPAIIPFSGSNFEKAVKFIYILGVIFLGSVHKEKVDKVRESKDLPGCNCIYPRSVLEEVMPIDEKLLTAEDVDLNSRITGAGYKLIFVPDVKVFHCRRSSPFKLFRQMFRFAVGRLQAGKKNIKMISLTHVLAGFSLPVLILLVIPYLISRTIFNFAIEVIIGGLAFIFLFALLKSKALAVAGAVIPALIIALSGWSLGFMRELFWPLKDIRGK